MVMRSARGLHHESSRKMGGSIRDGALEEERGLYINSTSIWISTYETKTARLTNFNENISPFLFAAYSTPSGR